MFENNFGFLLMKIQECRIILLNKGFINHTTSIITPMNPLYQQEKTPFDVIKHQGVFSFIWVDLNHV